MKYWAYILNIRATCRINLKNKKHLKKPRGEVSLADKIIGLEIQVGRKVYINTKRLKCRGH